MRVVFAPDSFKECLTAREVAAAMARGWQAVDPQAQCICVPMADGGEGTLDALLASRGGQRLRAWVEGPLGEPVRADWGLLANGTAIIEVAAASGLALVEASRRDALRASSFGTGQLIAEALKHDARHLLLTLGGSACNDGGAGMLQALGVSLRDAGGAELERGGAALARLHHVDLSGLDQRLQGCTFEAAVDVDNPLCGPRGASVVFGPQKGASPAQVALLDAALGHYARVLEEATGHPATALAGSGAAGGIGFALRCVLAAALRPGVSLVAEQVGLAAHMQGADLLVTGEGRLDGQTLHGKTPLGVARLAQAAGVPVVALGGSLGPGYEALYEQGVSAAFSLCEGPQSLAEAMVCAEQQIESRMRAIARLWRVAQGR